MNTLVKGAGIGIVVLLALGAIAMAIADAGSGDDAPNGVAQEATAAPVESEQPSPVPTEAAEPTEEPAANDDAEQESEAESASDAGTTTALNPAGHCVELPNDSDIVRNPDKHDNWTITACQPQNDDEKPDMDEPDGGDGENGNGPPEKVSMTNPAGQCVELPVTSDVVRNPQKHPGWTLGCDED
jgi:hypothetical protein